MKAVSLASRPRTRRSSIVEVKSQENLTSRNDSEAEPGHSAKGTEDAVVSEAHD